VKKQILHSTSEKLLIWC